MEDGHSRTVEDVTGFFGTDPEKGLTPAQVKSNQEKYGPNGELFFQTFLIKISSMTSFITWITDNINNF